MRITESIRDKMIAKTKKQIDKSIENTIDKITTYAMKDNEQLDDYYTTYEHFLKYKDKILRLVLDGDDIETIYNNIMYGI